MLHRDHTGAGLCGQESLGRKPHAIGADSSCDIVADLMIELHISGLFKPGIDVVLGHGDSF